MTGRVGSTPTSVLIHEALARCSLSWERRRPGGEFLELAGETPALPGSWGGRSFYHSIPPSLSIAIVRESKKKIAGRK